MKTARALRWCAATACVLAAGLPVRWAVAAPAHHLYVTVDTSANGRPVREIRRFPLNGARITHAPDAVYRGVSSPLIIGPDGTLYASAGSASQGKKNGIVAAFPPGSTHRSRTIVLPRPREYPGVTAYATALAVDPEGRLYVGYGSSPGVDCADTGVYLFAASANGHARPLADITFSGVGIYGLQFGARGTLIVAAGPGLGSGGSPYGCDGGYGPYVLTLLHPTSAPEVTRTLFGANFAQSGVCGYGITTDAAGNMYAVAVPACYAGADGATLAVYRADSAGFVPPVRAVAFPNVDTLRAGAQLGVQEGHVFVPFSGATYKNFTASGVYEYAVTQSGNENPLDTLAFQNSGGLFVNGVAIGP